MKATSFIDQTTLVWKNNIKSCCNTWVFYCQTITRDRFWTPINILDGAFCEKNQQILRCNYLLKSSTLDVWWCLKSTSGNIKYGKLLSKLFSVKTVYLKWNIGNLFGGKNLQEQYLQPKPFRVASEAATRGVLRNFTKFTGKHLCQSLSPATLFKKRLRHSCFPVTFVKFLRTPFLQRTSGRLFL